MVGEEEEDGDEESQLIPRAITNIPVFSESTPGFMMSMMMVMVGPDSAIVAAVGNQ